MISLRLSDDKRDLFKEQLGTLTDVESLKNNTPNTKLITVGDVVSHTVSKIGLIPDLCVYDGYTERREHTDFANLVKSKGLKETVVKNPAGMITADLMNAVKNALVSGKKEIIRVDGEEDLALMPCVLFAPIGSRVVYGWPGVGMMLIVTDSNNVGKIGKLMQCMEEIQ